MLSDVCDEMHEHITSLETASILCLLLTTANEHAHRAKEMRWVPAERVHANEPLELSNFWPAWLDKDDPGTTW